MKRCYSIATLVTGLNLRRRIFKKNRPRSPLSPPIGDCFLSRGPIKKTMSVCILPSFWSRALTRIRSSRPVHYRVFTAADDETMGLPSLMAFAGVWQGFVGFFMVFPGFLFFTGFSRNWPGFTEFYWALQGLTQFYWTLNGFDRVLPGFTGFYWVFTVFCWFLLSFTGLNPVLLNA